MEGNENIDVRAYYQRLKKGDKSKFLGHLYSTYGLIPYTMGAKLCKMSKLTIRPLEEIAIREAITSDEWRK